MPSSQLRPPSSSSSSSLAVVGLGLLLLLLASSSSVVLLVQANPKSRPYVAYRTDPFDQEIVKRRILADGIETRGSSPGSGNNNGGNGGGPRKNKVQTKNNNNHNNNNNTNNGNYNNGRKEEEEEGDERCPLSFRLGSTHSTHFGSSSNTNANANANANNDNINNDNKQSNNNHHHTTTTTTGLGAGTHTPPIIYPLHPDFDAGSGRQILLTTDYEVLEMWTPSSALGSHAVGGNNNNDAKSFNGGSAAAAAAAAATSSGGGGGGGGGGGAASSSSDTIGQSSTEQMKEDEQFPLLFESSSFYHTSPIVHDVEGDGIADAILGDYDGNLHLVGLDFERVGGHDDGGGGSGGGGRGNGGRGSGGGGDDRHKRRKRYYHRLAIPRLHVRKSWFDVAINRTLEEQDMAAMDAGSSENKVENTGDANANGEESSAEKTPGTKKWEEFEPYHTYFAGPSDTAWRGDEEALRAYSGDVLNMDADLAKRLTDRKKTNRRMMQKEPQQQQQQQNEMKNEPKNGNDVEEDTNGGGDSTHRRLQEVGNEAENIQDNANNMMEEDVTDNKDRTEIRDAVDNEASGEREGNMQNPDYEVYGQGENNNAGPSDYDYMYADEPELFADDSIDAPPDGTGDGTVAEKDPSIKNNRNWGDDHFPHSITDDTHDDKKDGMEDGADGEMMDDYHYHERYGGYGDDMYRPQAPEGYDSYEEYEEIQSKYYHEKNYLRLPPHLLSSPTLVELPRSYVGANADYMDRVDELLLCAVSYYFDEDEYSDSSKGAQSFRKQANVDGGDETEEKRGRYVASAIMGYNLRWKYWSVQEVLDLSTDWSAPLGDIVKGGTAPMHSNAHGGMGAWALATPIAVKLDGGNNNHILLGTSMGLVYALEVQYHGVKGGWPVQMRHPVEQKVVVEDVVGNTNLEVFVVDVGGDLVSLNADGEVLWARNLLEEEDEKDLTKTNIHVVRGTSPMSMGDVEGSGKLAIVLVAKVAMTERSRMDRPDNHEGFEYRIFAIDAVTGDDLPNFPIVLDGGSNLSRTTAMPQALLVDLHEDQSHWLDNIHGFSDDDVDAIRAINREAAKKRNARLDSESLPLPRPHGGSGRGLHIVQPLGHTLHIIEGSTSCSQTIDVGDPVPSMVQADDVHGTGGLDLVVTTSQGEILTLESDVVPYHPLNVWNAGVTRSPGSSNAQAHGYSSTQGIFVHPIARQFRDILGIYVPVTFEIFDRRPNIANEPNRRVYQVEVRAGMSAKRTIFSHTYNTTGVYTERIQIPFGPGYYALSVRLRTTHGIVYEDTFHIGFNVNYMGGLWWIVCFPLILATIPILMFRRKPNWEEDEDYGGRGTGILGRAPPS